MKKEAFDTLEIAEGSWWDRGRQAAVRSVLRGTYGTALDFGAGFGSQISLLKKYASSVLAYEPEQGLHEALKRRGYDRVFDQIDDALAREYDLIALLDVLEHVEDHVALARRLEAALRPGGMLIVTVPAYQWLWSEHDTLNMHFRRYTTTSLAQVLKEAGFEIEYLGYWNMMLLLPLAAVRALGGTGKAGLETGSFGTAILSAWLRLEAFVLRHVRLPFGVSIIARARKVPTGAMQPGTGPGLP